MNFPYQTDLWSYLRETEKTVVLYGMGNGADKILAICEQNGIEVADFFASDSAFFICSKVLFPRFQIRAYEWYLQTVLRQCLYHGTE